MSAYSDKYYPALFNRDSQVEKKTEDENIIPQTTLYDMPLQSQHVPAQKHVTVFGFSQQNRQNVIAAIKKSVKIEKKEEGKNYISIWTEDPADLEKILNLNHKVINGEILGAFRKNFGVIKDTGIYLKKKGIFRKIREYFFGEE